MTDSRKGKEEHGMKPQRTENGKIIEIEGSWKMERKEGRKERREEGQKRRGTERMNETLHQERSWQEPVNRTHPQTGEEIKVRNTSKKL